MRYVSTRGEAPILGFDDVLLQGLASDGGLYVPERWPRWSSAGGDYASVAAGVVMPFVEGSVVESDIETLTRDVYGSFRHPDVAPLRAVEHESFLLELFWGPTLSFKDYALQLLGRLFDRVLAARGQRVLVLGATSGDTGSAAIAALAGLDSVDVVILFPEGRVSEVQRRQMTTVPDANVRAVAVPGTFDDCQDLVKAAFADESLRSRYRLAAVNSINWARVMAQAAYYMWTSEQIDGTFDVAVPTGNFGNVLAANVAQAMGAPIGRLLVANNANHGLATLIETGRLPLGEVVPTSAPAMDIQVPSNLERYLFELFGRRSTREMMERMRRDGGLVLDEVHHTAMRERFGSAWLDDDGIAQVLRSVYDRHGLVIDPHTATAWAAAEEHRRPGVPVVTVATAHPAKFGDAVEAATGVVPELPADLADLLDRPERVFSVDNSLDDLAGLLAEVVHWS